MFIELFFAKTCYGWGATSEYQLKIGYFAPTGGGWPKISGRRVISTNHSSSQKTRINILSYGIKSGQICLPFCHNARVWNTDSILIARRRLHCMQRVKKQTADQIFTMLNKRSVNDSRRQHDQLDNCSSYSSRHRFSLLLGYWPKYKLSQSWNKNVTTCLQWIILVTLISSTVDHVTTYTYRMKSRFI